MSFEFPIPKRFRVVRSEERIEAELVGRAGDAEGPGRLVVVESILVDPDHNRLLIADEDEAERTIKVYDLEGRFTGTRVGEGIFQAEPEGIALWSCGAQGYGMLAPLSSDQVRKCTQAREPCPACVVLR